MTETELRRRFVMALDADVPAPAPGLEARVLDAVDRGQRIDMPVRQKADIASTVSSANRGGRLRPSQSQSIRVPRLMGLVAALLALAIVAGLVFVGRGLHLRTSVPAGHPYAPVWSHGLVHNYGAIAFTTDGFVILPDHESGNIIKLNASDGRETLRWGGLGNSPGQFASLYFVAVDAQNNVYATDHLTGRVFKFDENGKYLQQWQTETSGVSGIGVDAASRVWVALSGTHDHYIQAFTTEGRLVAEFGRTGNGPGEFERNYSDQGGPGNIVVEPDGSVWVVDWESGRLYHFAGDGGLLLQAGPGTPILPETHFQDVYPGMNGHVYADIGTDVRELDASGHDLGVFDARTYGLPVHHGYYPIPVADHYGNLYVFDLFSSTVTKVSRR